MARNAYCIRVVETLSRSIVVYAEDADEAYELAENLCNNGDVLLTDDDFDTRDFFVSTATEFDLKWCSSETYDREGRIGVEVK
jgi:hypothetical protein